MCFLALAVYVTFESVSGLINKKAPEYSIAGIDLGCVSLILLVWSLWRTEAKAYRKRSVRQWTRGARRESESGRCARGSGSWAAPWKSNLMAAEQLSQRACRVARNPLVDA